MKTISIEMKDNVYQTLLDFLKLLPKSDFTIYDDENIDEEEKKEIRRLNQMINNNDLNEFEDYEAMKRDLYH